MFLFLFLPLYCSCTNDLDTTTSHLCTPWWASHIYGGSFTLSYSSLSLSLSLFHGTTFTLSFIRILNSGGDALLHCILEVRCLFSLLQADVTEIFLSLPLSPQSYPAAFTYWSKANGPEIIVSNSKYETIVTSVPNVLYKSNLKLRIRNVNTADLTSYSCVAKNSLGETRGTVKLALDASTSPSERQQKQQQQQQQQQQIEQQQQQQQQQQQESKRINYSTGQYNCINFVFLNKTHPPVCLTISPLLLHPVDPSPSFTWKSNHEKNSSRPATTNLTLKSSSSFTLPFSLSYHLMCLCMLQFASMFH